MIQYETTIAGLSLLCHECTNWAFGYIRRERIYYIHTSDIKMICFMQRHPELYQKKEN